MGSNPVGAAKPRKALIVNALRGFLQHLKTANTLYICLIVNFLKPEIDPIVYQQLFLENKICVKSHLIEVLTTAVINFKFYPQTN
ncbi:MAG: hypothetical protein C0592_09130 [Marinilabiliales bacterium]|nr:MAG: hypothetical protein C0592_09130 [Marinilabiliales bacterium]